MFSLIRNIDIYLLDQLFKSRIPPTYRILDAGSGSGRNIEYFLEQHYDVTAIDLNDSGIETLRNKYPDRQANFQTSTIEQFLDDSGFDYIICNAVLHFADNHVHFDQMFQSLIDKLRPGGTLFIRTCSDIGIENKIKIIRPGVYDLPDGTERYLINREKIKELVEKFGLTYIEPVRSVNVADMRVMTTLVLNLKK